MRFLRPAWGVVVKFQSYLVPRVEPFLPGMLMLGSSGAAGPASMTRILELGRFWLRRAESARPAVPPPTMICIQDQLWFGSKMEMIFFTHVVVDFCMCNNDNGADEGPKEAVLKCENHLVLFSRSPVVVVERIDHSTGGNFVPNNY